MSEAGINNGLLDFVYDFYKGMKTHEITLAYEGEINQQIIKAFTSLAEGAMFINKESEVLQKKVYHVMVECLQNIARHASHPENEDSPEYGYSQGILIISRNQREYQVTTGNIIQKSRTSNLSDLINHINSLSKEELNILHKDQLRNGHLSDKGGAGLGFIDIRRKTGTELAFKFIPVSESHEFFLFTSKIPR